MKIAGFSWAEDTALRWQHKHNIDQDEVEEVFAGRSQCRLVETGPGPDEAVYAALGQTQAGRYLIVFFIHQEEQKANILWARDMKRAERGKYEPA